MSSLACFNVLVFDPKTTIPPITTAIAPIKIVGLNQTAPSGDSQQPYSSDGDGYFRK
jgi:hypothetical protein